MKQKSLETLCVLPICNSIFTRMSNKHILSTLLGSLLIPQISAAVTNRPNILFVISDDQSYPHASAYGSSLVKTPGFDLVAQNGWLFNNAFVTSPGSSPSRASILTGLYPWQIEEAGTHASSFPVDYKCFPDLLGRQVIILDTPEKAGDLEIGKYQGASVTRLVPNIIKCVSILHIRGSLTLITLKISKNFFMEEKENNLLFLGRYK